MKRLEGWLSLGLVLTLGFLLGILGFSVWDKPPSNVERISWSHQAQWIAPSQPNYRFYARKTFYVNDTVQGGWLRLSADNDFVLYVNGLVVAQEVSTPRNTLGLASKLSETFQRFNESVPYTGLIADWIQVSFPRDWKLTSYIDVTPYLRTGKNVIGLEVQKSRQNPRVVVEGAVYTVPGSSPIDLTTGATSWRTSTLSESRQWLRWFDPDFPDSSWSEARTMGSVKEATYSRVSQNLYTRPVQGSWITGNESLKGEVWLRKLWQVSQKPRRAFIRFAGDGEYALLINGLLVKRYPAGDGNLLRMYEVTNFVQTGVNTLAVRLARPLDSRSMNNGSVQFFLDGWVETDIGEIVAAIATDKTWSAVNHPVSGWTEGSGEAQPATLLASAQPKQFRYSFEGNAYLFNYPDYLLHQILWQLGGIICALVYAWGLGRLWLGGEANGWDSFGAGAALLLPGSLFLIGIGLLKHRYAQSEQALLFAQAHSNSLILLGFVGIVLFTLLASQIRRNLGGWPRWSLWFLLGLIAYLCLALLAGGSVFFILLSGGGIAAITLFWIWGREALQKFLLQEVATLIRQQWSIWGHWFLLILIVGSGFALRIYHLGSTDLEPDESTSLDATMGILRTGAPIASSGIWYTRGPFYHYQLAIWLKIVGASAVNARLLSVLWGTATLVFVFFFARKFTGKVWIALAVTAILAIDPWEIWYSRNIRFYQVAQFLTLLGFWSFFKGFVERVDKRYQSVYFVALTLNLLTQEVTLTIPPAFIFGFLYFYRPFKIFKEFPILLGSAMTMLIFAYNILFVSVISLTPWVGLSSMTTSFIKFHFSNVTIFTNNFFVGFNQLYTIYSFFFFGGMIYALKRRERPMIFLFSSVIINVILVTILVVLVFTRYTYPMYPLFILLSVYGAVNVTESLGRRMEYRLEKLLPLKNVAVFFTILLLLVNIEPVRVLNSYSDSITVRHSQVAQYVRDHRQVGDVVISNVPAAHADTIGGADYYLPHRMSFFDAVYMKDGRLVDRWEGGVVFTNPDQMTRIFEKANRVWIHLSDREQPPKAIELNKLDTYLRTVGQPVLDTFGTRLRLWQREDGLLPRIPNRGRDLGNF